MAADDEADDLGAPLDGLLAADGVDDAHAAGLVGRGRALELGAAVLLAGARRSRPRRLRLRGGELATEVADPGARAGAFVVGAPVLVAPPVGALAYVRDEATARLQTSHQLFVSRRGCRSLLLLLFLFNFLLLGKDILILVFLLLIVFCPTKIKLFAVRKPF